MDLTQFNPFLFIAGFAGTIVFYLAFERFKFRRPKKGKKVKAKAGAAPTQRAPEKPSVPQRADEVDRVVAQASPVGLGNGFRELRWGMPPPEDMTALEMASDFATLVREGDDLRLGAAKLESIRYHFWRNKLAGVVLEIEPESLEKVTTELYTAYGAPAREKGDTRYVWPAAPSGETITQVVLEADPERKAGTVTMVSRTISEIRKKSAKND